MFCVFGKSKQVARKKLTGQLIKGKGTVTERVSELGSNASQNARELVFEECVQEEFLKMKPCKCTHDFSAPEFAIEAMAIMKADKENFSELTIMKRVYRENTEGKTVVSKSTGKPLFNWVSLFRNESRLTAA